MRSLVYSEDIKEEIRKGISCERYLKKSKNGMYVCPFCLSGTGKNKTGALKLYDSNTWSCHKCSKSGDVLDLIQLENNCSFEDALLFGSSELGLQIKPSKIRNVVSNSSANRAKIDHLKNSNSDYTEYYKICCRRLCDSKEAISYLLSRGISLESAISCGIGFDSNSDPANNPGGTSTSIYPTPRIIIPTSKSHYVARSILPDSKYPKLNPSCEKGASSPGIFNSSVLKDSDVVYITEGAFDALSIVEMGRSAIAINSVNNINKILDFLKENPSGCSFVISFDNDKDENTLSTTKSYAENLRVELENLGYKNLIFNISGKFKDPNEALVNDRSNFRRSLEEAEKKLQCDYLDDFLLKVKSESYRPCKTGIDFFDSLLGGGIVRQSLLVLMAAPGVGKTTFAQQVSESLASNGFPILYFNLEMSREQMLAKAISGRLRKKGIKKTALQILQGYNWSIEDEKLITEEIKYYRKNIFPYIKYNPEISSCDVEDILKYLNNIGENCKRSEKQAPAIVFDYLHLISSKSKIDAQDLIKKSILGFKNYAKNYDTFVICIVATNRISNINGRITMESGRDSSNIEYTGDYQLSLNYYEIDNGDVKTTETDKISELQMREWRRMIIRVLKGRFISPGRSATVYFNASNNIFRSQDEMINSGEMDFDDIFEEDHRW